MKRVLFSLFSLLIVSFPGGWIHAVQTDSKISVVMTYPCAYADLTEPIIRQTYQQVREAGIDISNIYYEWGYLEPRQGDYIWNDLDYDIAIMGEYNLEVSLEIKLIDNNHLGAFPEEVTFSTFDDPLFIDQFKSFVLTLLDRYQGDISYLWIGNEIDAYLSQHPEHLAGFKQLYSETYAAIKELHPAVLVGTISTYHDAKVNGTLDVIETLGTAGDLIGFSFYPETMPGMEPSDTGMLFDDMASIAARLDKKFAILETGWSTLGPNGSSEQQVAFVDELFDAYAAHIDQIEFVGWFTLYDLAVEDALFVLAPYGIGPEHEDFVNFARSLGLGDNDGTMKASWNEFVQRQNQLGVQDE